MSCPAIWLMLSDGNRQRQDGDDEQLRRKEATEVRELSSPFEHSGYLNVVRRREEDDVGLVSRIVRNAGGQSDIACSEHWRTLSNRASFGLQFGR